jgi:hypothetical protein
MDLTFLGSSTNFWITALYLPVLVVVLITDVGQVIGVGRRVRFKLNALLALRNLAAFSILQQVLAMAVGVIQKLTQNTVWTTIPTSVPMQSGKFGSATLLSGAFSDGFGEVSGLSQGSRLAMSGQFTLDMVTIIFASATVMVIAHVAYKSMPFDSLIPRLLRLNALAILVLQTLSQYLGGVARASISHDVLENNTLNPDLPQPIGLSTSFPMWQALVALCLFALAAIYSKGKKLQDDTAGLV